jgi:hypothetical protein
MRLFKRKNLTEILEAPTGRHPEVVYCPRFLSRR